MLKQVQHDAVGKFRVPETEGWPCNNSPRPPRVLHFALFSTLLSTHQGTLGLFPWNNSASVMISNSGYARPVTSLSSNPLAASPLRIGWGSCPEAAFRGDQQGEL